jgi:hypothetical protein
LGIGQWALGIGHWRLEKLTYFPFPLPKSRPLPFHFSLLETIRTLAAWYELILGCPEKDVTGAPRKIPARATESIKPPVAAAIKERLSFTQISQLQIQQILG